MAVVSGKVAFESLWETDTYLGQDTGKYNIVLTLGEAEASKLTDLGVNVKEYEGNGQRKFTSKFPIKVIDADDQPFKGPLPRGSEVRVLFNTGDPHPQYGTPTYANAVRVLEVAEPDVDYSEL